ncbi:hypothetical protein GZH46_02077, partial [Fragariocoptes setiger]
GADIEAEQIGYRETDLSRWIQQQWQQQRGASVMSQRPPIPPRPLRSIAIAPSQGVESSSGECYNREGNIDLDVKPKTITKETSDVVATQKGTSRPGSKKYRMLRNDSRRQHQRRMTTPKRDLSPDSSGPGSASPCVTPTQTHTSRKQLLSRWATLVSVTGGSGERLSQHNISHRGQTQHSPRARSGEPGAPGSKMRRADTSGAGSVANAVSSLWATLSLYRFASSRNNVASYQSMSTAFNETPPAIGKSKHGQPSAQESSQSSSPVSRGFWSRRRDSRSPIDRKSSPPLLAHQTIDQHGQLTNKPSSLLSSPKVSTTTINQIHHPENVATSSIANDKNNSNNNHNSDNNDKFTLQQQHQQQSEEKNQFDNSNNNNNNNEQQLNSAPVVIVVPLNEGAPQVSVSAPVHSRGRRDWARLKARLRAYRRQSKGSPKASTPTHQVDAAGKKQSSEIRVQNKGEVSDGSNKSPTNKQQQQRRQQQTADDEQVVPNDQDLVLVTTTTTQTISTITTTSTSTTTTSSVTTTSQTNNSKRKMAQFKQMITRQQSVDSYRSAQLRRAKQRHLATATGNSNNDGVDTGEMCGANSTRSGVRRSDELVEAIDLMVSPMSLQQAAAIGKPESRKQLVSNYVATPIAVVTGPVDETRRDNTSQDKTKLTDTKSCDSTHDANSSGGSSSSKPSVKVLRDSLRLPVQSITTNCNNNNNHSSNNNISNGTTTGTYNKDNSNNIAAPQFGYAGSFSGSITPTYALNGGLVSPGLSALAGQQQQAHCPGGVSPSPSAASTSTGATTGANMSAQVRYKYSNASTISSITGRASIVSSNCQMNQSTTMLANAAETTSVASAGGNSTIGVTSVTAGTTSTTAGASQNNANDNNNNNNNNSNHNNNNNHDHKNSNTIGSGRYIAEQQPAPIAAALAAAESIYDNRCDLGEEMKFLASLPELCDITFLVGETREPVCAVRSVLAARSRVFHKILFGSRFAPLGGLNERNAQRRDQRMRHTFDEHTAETTNNASGTSSKLIDQTSDQTGNNTHNNNNNSATNNTAATRATSIDSQGGHTADSGINSAVRSSMSGSTGSGGAIHSGRRFLGSSNTKRANETSGNLNTLSSASGTTTMLNAEPVKTMIIEEFEPDVFRQLIEYIHTGCVLLQARTLLEVVVTSDVVPARHKDKSRQHQTANASNITFMIEHKTPQVTPESDASNVQTTDDESHQSSVQTGVEKQTSTPVDTSTERGTSGKQTKVVGAKTRKIPPRNVKSTYARNLAAIIDGSECLNFSKLDNYQQAINADDSADWKAAIDDELRAHARNNTWELVPKTKQMKEISAKWVFKLKHAADGSIERRKARLVARGFVQVAGVDYGEIFAPVVRMDSIRLLFSLCAQFNLGLEQFDIATAFLNGVVEEDLYLQPPEGLSVPAGYTCKLKKSLYSLKQAPRCWKNRFTEMLRLFNMKQTTSHPCVFVSKEPELMYLAVYVDDGLVFAKNKGGHSAYTFIRVDTLNVFWNVLTADPKAVATPLEAGHILNKPSTLEQEPIQGVPYAEAVGSLLYCAMATRPDIAFALPVLSKFTKSPRPQHWQAVKREFWYLRGTMDYGLLYKPISNPRIVCYSDADYAGDHENRRSTSGMICMINSGGMVNDVPFVSKHSNRAALHCQPLRLSVAVAMAVKELIWLKHFVNEVFQCLLNAADYYGLEQLRKACLRFVTCCISVDTVCSLLSTAERYIQYKCTKSIVQKVLEFVDQHANEVFRLNAFGLLPEHVVRLILARDSLKADELIKFNGVYTWCEHYCRQYELTNMADVMANFLEFIEFHKIPTHALVKDIHPTGLVPDTLVMSALAHQADPTTIEAPPARLRRMTLPANTAAAVTNFANPSGTSHFSNVSSSSKRDSATSSKRDSKAHNAHQSKTNRRHKTGSNASPTLMWFASHISGGTPPGDTPTTSSVSGEAKQVVRKARALLRHMSSSASEAGSGGGTQVASTSPGGGSPGATGVSGVGSGGVVPTSADGKPSRGRSFRELTIRRIFKTSSSTSPTRIVGPASGSDKFALIRQQRAPSKRRKQLPFRRSDTHR